MMTMTDLASVAEANDFGGVVRIEREGQVVVELARGLADRSNQIANRLDTRFATASATKGFTALTIASLAETGELSLDATVRSVVGELLPLVDAGVTIRHLLSHTSGIGDYLDEEALGDIDEHILGVSAHTLERPTDYLPLLVPHAQKRPPGEEFVYNNSGYMILSIIIELIAGSFHDAVRDRVLTPAGVHSGGFFRSDELPPDAALGYLNNGRTNVFHLPVIGGGDGGIYLSLDDVSAFWRAFFGCSIVSESMVELMTTPVHPTKREEEYGLGFWLANGGRKVMLVGMDAGVSFKTSYDRESNASYTVISNTSSDVWALAKWIEQVS